MIFLSTEIYSQDKGLINKSIQFISSTFIINDSNPMEKKESDSIESIFKESINQHINKNDKQFCDSEILEIFKILYDNGQSVYSDSDEERRIKLRRSLCFTSIALLSKIENSYTFIEYAKFTLSDNKTASCMEFLEEQYLGLLFIELVLKAEDNQLDKNDLKIVNEFIEKNKNNISTDVISKAKALLEYYNVKYQY